MVHGITFPLVSEEPLAIFDLEIDGIEEWWDEECHHCGYDDYVYPKSEMFTRAELKSSVREEELLRAEEAREKTATSRKERDRRCERRYQGGVSSMATKVYYFCHPGIVCATQAEVWEVNPTGEHARFTIRELKASGFLECRKVFDEKGARIVHEGGKWKVFTFDILPSGTLDELEEVYDSFEEFLAESLEQSRIYSYE